MTEQLSEAGMLLAVGMAVVFSFLTLLIAGVHGIAWFVRVFPEPEKANSYSQPSYHKKNQKNQDTNNKGSRPTTVQPAIVSAITAAVNEHRRTQK